jgi:hypothetical protein
MAQRSAFKAPLALLPVLVVFLHRLSDVHLMFEAMQPRTRRPRDGCYIQKSFSQYAGSKLSATIQHNAFRRRAFPAEPVALITSTHVGSIG